MTTGDTTGTTGRNNQYWQLETQTTTDTGNWSHERPILELLPEPQTTDDTGATGAMNDRR